PGSPDPSGTAEGSAPPSEPPTGSGHDSAGHDSAGHDSAGHDSATRAARLNAAFRAATRNVWPGTEDRQPVEQSGDQPPAAEPPPDPAPPSEPSEPSEPGLTSFGPLGAGAQANRQIWEPRQLHQV